MRAAVPHARAGIHRVGRDPRWPAAQTPRSDPQLRAWPGRRRAHELLGVRDQASARPPAGRTPPPRPRHRDAAPGRPIAPIQRPRPRQAPSSRARDAMLADRDPRRHPWRWPERGAPAGDRAARRPGKPQSAPADAGIARVPRTRPAQWSSSAATFRSPPVCRPQAVPADGWLYGSPTNEAGTLPLAERGTALGTSGSSLMCGRSTPRTFDL